MPADSRPSSEERDHRASKDDRPDNYRVAIRDNGAANGGYAYHTLNEEDEPLCNAGDNDAEFVLVSLSDAQRRNKAPCGMCERISSQRKESCTE